MATKHTLTDEEKKLLKAAMQDVKLLPKKALLEPELSVRRRPKISPKAAALTPLPTARKGAADTQTINKLRQGTYTIDAKIDLHGMTLDEAYTRLATFIEAHYAKQSRCLLIITGKGGKDGGKGQLQRAVPRWLSLSDMASRILVVSQAVAKHGGQGALYILLRRAQK
jgi:DNA-nicking Smr family endonuclease